jgi:hypothetical protein
MVKIRLASKTLGLLAVFVSLASGCVRREWAPQLFVPQRPALEKLTTEEWSAIPDDSRGKLSRNLTLIYQHVEELEQTVRSYEEWRLGRSN